MRCSALYGHSDGINASCRYHASHGAGLMVGAASWPQTPRPLSPRPPGPHPHMKESVGCAVPAAMILSSLGRGFLRGESPLPAEGGQQPPWEARALPAISALRMMKMFVNGAEVKG